MKTNANGIAIEYEQTGTGGETVTLVHALGTSMRMWQRQLPALESGYRVIRYDVRGHGGTDKPDRPYSLEVFADDLFALLLSLGVTRTHLVGLSMGGMIAQYFALAYRHMLSSLVLCDTACKYPPEAKAQMEERAAKVEREGMEHLVEPMIERWFTPAYIEEADPILDEIRGLVARNDPRAYANATRAVSRVDTADRLKNLKAPTLVIVGDQDPGTPPAYAEEIARRIQGARLEVIQDASHMTAIQQAGRFNQLLMEVLAANRP